jgi:hypothetical protein
MENTVTVNLRERIELKIENEAVFEKYVTDYYIEQEKKHLQEDEKLEKIEKLIK